ncbi:MAG: PLDc N-terminal domain-containing protein, partial [Planctomycetaceae bacterium]|nr:PLDc N-terminal domain-containing protein [Planctomycetaceae bacterium]
MLDLLEWFLASAWPWIIAAVHLVLMLGASAHVVLTKRDPRAAIGWVGVILLTPLVGTLLYVMFGINRIQRRARALRQAVGQRGSSAGIRGVSQDVIERILGEEGEHLAPLTTFVNRLTDLPLVDGNHITPLCGGRPTYDAML